MPVEFSSSFDYLGPVLQICLIDLLLSGDNAILIAMACRSLAPDLRRKAVFAGTGAAVLFRVLMTFAATLALRAPYLKLIGAVLLLLIAIELLASPEETHRHKLQRNAGDGMFRALLLIVVADAVMSLDNVVAVAAAAQDNLWYLILGLALSVPILVFSSLVVVRLLESYPMLVEGGAALLGWIAGKTAVSDPAIAASLQAQSFGLVALAPLLGAVYVLVQGRILREQRRLSAAAPGIAPVLATAAAQGRAAWPAPAPASAAGAVPVPAEAPAPVAELPAAAFAPPAVTLVQPAPAHVAVLHSAGSQAALAEPATAPREQAAPGAQEAAGREAAGQDAASRAGPEETVRKLSSMDLTILAGVAVPALGLVATLIYIIAKAIASR
jgi:YjbE family integral membrane protein